MGEKFKEFCFVLPAKIKAEEEKKEALAIELCELRETTKRIEVREKLDISQAQIDGKLVYTNEFLRGNELSRRLEKMPEYENVQTRIKVIEQDIGRLNIEITYLKNNFELCKLYGRDK